MLKSSVCKSRANISLPVKAAFTSSMCRHRITRFFTLHHDNLTLIGNALAADHVVIP